MTSETIDWSIEWAGLSTSHRDGLTLLQFALDALQGKLPGDFAVTLWVCLPDAGQWKPLITARGNISQAQPWQMSGDDASRYLAELQVQRELTVFSEADGICHTAVAQRELSQAAWLEHWLCGNGDDFIGILEIGGNAPGNDEQAQIRRVVGSCLAVLQCIIESPALTIDTNLNGLSAQLKSYDTLVEEERLLSLGKLVASVTHEINSPLGVAITSVSLLKDALKNLNKHFSKGTLTESLFRNFITESAEVTDLLSFNLDRAVKLIGDFKTNSVNQSIDKPIKCSLQKVISSTTNSLLPELKRHDIQLVVSRLPECEIISYPGAFSQIITNLVFNSIHHAFAGTEHKKIELTAALDEQTSVLTLIYRDNGNGISSETQKMVFEPFFTTRRESGGSGLGLSIVKTLVNSKLKGHMEFTSELSKGVSFTFELPLNIA